MSQISYENQIERLNRLVKTMKQFAALPEERVLAHPETGGWSVVETVEHMNKAFAPHYRDHLEAILNRAPEQEDAQTGFQGGLTARLIYYTMKPRAGKRRMKMKTLKKFQPERGQVPDPKRIFNEFFKHQESLKAQILKARTRDISGKRLPSAIGPLIRFTVPECFEFLIVHEERHVLQCREIIERLEQPA